MKNLADEVGPHVFSSLGGERALRCKLAYLNARIEARREQNLPVDDLIAEHEEVRVALYGEDD